MQSKSPKDMHVPSTSLNSYIGYGVSIRTLEPCIGIEGDPTVSAPLTVLDEANVLGIAWMAGEPRARGVGGG